MSATCSSTDCDRPVDLAGLCRRHYAQRRLARVRTAGCSVIGCDRAQFCRALCRGHYARSLRGQEVDAPLRDQRLGNVPISCRVTHAASERLRHRAKAAGTSISKMAASLLEESLAGPS